jgi:hypothetical protein
MEKRSDARSATGTVPPPASRVKRLGAPNAASTRPDESSGDDRSTALQHHEGEGRRASYGSVLHRAASTPVASERSRSAIRIPSWPYGWKQSNAPSGPTTAEVVGDPAPA